jgi:PHP domain
MLDRNRFSNVLSNTDIAELLARQAERERGILSRAFRRAARAAFLWPEEVSHLAAQNRSLTELRGIGPFIEKQIRQWLDKPPHSKQTVPTIRQDFISLAKARQLLAGKQTFARNLRSDLQMHTRWSDGSGTIAEMAEAASERSYEYIAITDHSKGLKIAGGINERDLEEQGAEIAKLNTSLRKSGRSLVVLSSLEMNLNKRGEGDMSRESLSAVAPCSRFVPFLFADSRGPNGSLSGSTAQPTHSDPRSPTRSHLQFSNRLECRLAARLCRSDKARQGAGS